jgi:hypothetical protein
VNFFTPAPTRRRIESVVSTLLPKKDTTMVAIAFSALLGLALALAYARGTSTARPRGRFAPALAWQVLPALPAPRIRRHALAMARSVGLL